MGASPQGMFGATSGLGITQVPRAALLEPAVRDPSSCRPSLLFVPQQETVMSPPSLGRPIPDRLPRTAGHLSQAGEGIGEGRGSLELLRAGRCVLHVGPRCLPWRTGQVVPGSGWVGEAGGLRCTALCFPVSVAEQLVPPWLLCRPWLPAPSTPQCRGGPSVVSDPGWCGTGGLLLSVPCAVCTSPLAPVACPR